MIAIKKSHMQSFFLPCMRDFFVYTLYTVYTRQF